VITDVGEIVVVLVPSLTVRSCELRLLALKFVVLRLVAFTVPVVTELFVIVVPLPEPFDTVSVPVALTLPVETEVGVMVVVFPPPDTVRLDAPRLVALKFVVLNVFAVIVSVLMLDAEIAPVESEADDSAPVVEMVPVEAMPVVEIAPVESELEDSAPEVEIVPVEVMPVVEIAPVESEAD